MDSLTEEDLTLPIDFNQTGNFAHYLAQHQLMERNDSIQSDVTLSEVFPPSKEPGKEDENQDPSSSKVRSFSANDQPMERPSSRGGLMREQENIISELKKECFGLKMRIYYMEERLHEIYDVSTEDIIKTNIELKVRIEELKRDMQEKSDLLAKASQAMDQITSQKDEDLLELAKSQTQEEVEKTKVLYEEKLQRKNEDMEKLVIEIDQLTIKLLEKESDDKTAKDQSKIIDSLKKKMENIEAENKKIKETKQNDETALKSMILELEGTLEKKEEKIETLTKSKVNAHQTTKEFHDVFAEKEEELAAQINLVISLKKQLDEQKTISEKIVEQSGSSDKIIKGLRSKLHDKELEKQKLVKQFEDGAKKFAHEDKLKSQREEHTQDQQNYNGKDAINLRDKQMIEIQVELKDKQYAIEKLALRNKEKDQDILYFNNKMINLQNELCEQMKKQNEEKEKILNEYNGKLSTKQLKIEELQKLCHALESQLTSDLSQRDLVITDLAHAVNSKDNFIKNLVGSPIDETSKEAQDYKIKQLQAEVKDKEHRNKDLHTDFLHQLKVKDEALCKLSKELQEKDVLMKRLETKYALVREQYKNMELNDSDQKLLMRQLKSLLEASMTKEKDIQSSYFDNLHQKDLMIEKLTNLLAIRDNEFKNFEQYLNELVEKAANQNSIDEMKETSNVILMKFEKQMNDKDDLLKEINSLKEETSHLLKYQEFVSLLKEKDIEIKELRNGLQQQQDEKNTILKELNMQLVTTEQELKHLNEALIKLKNTQEKESLNFRNSAKEKDEAIQNFVRSGKDKDDIISDMKSRLDDMKFIHQEALTKKDEFIKEKQKKIDELNAKLIKKQGKEEEKPSRNGSKEEKFKTLLEKLDQLLLQVEKEKKTYLSLIEKIENNLHPDSLTKVLEQEANELGKLRITLQDLLITAVDENPSKSLDKLQNGFLQEHFELKDLYKSKRHEFDSVTIDNQSLKELVKAKELEMRQKEIDKNELNLNNSQILEEIKESENKLQDELQEANEEKCILQKNFVQLQEKHNECLIKETKHKDITNQMKTNSAKLIDKLSQADKELEELRTKLSLHISEKNSLESKISSHSEQASDEKKALKKDIKELCNINERLRNKIKDLNKKIDAVKSEKEKEKNIIYDKLQTSKIDMQNILEEKENLVEKLSDTEGRLKDFEEGKYLPLLKKYEQLENCTKNLQKKNESCTKHQRVAKADNMNLQGELKLLSDENIALKIKLEQKDKFENEVLNNKQELLEKTLQINILQNDLSHYKSKYDELQSSITNIKKRNESLKSEREALMEKHDSLRVQLHDAEIDQKEFSRLQYELENLRDRKVTLESQLKELGDSAGGIKSKLSMTIDENLAKEKQIHHLKCQIDKLEEQMESFSPLHTSSRHNIALSSDAFTQTKSELASEKHSNRDDNNSLIAAHIQEMRELRKQLEETIKNNDSLRHQLEERLNQIESEAKQLHDPVLRVSLIRDNDSMRIKIKTQESMIQKYQEQMNDLNNEKSSDKENITKLEGQIHDLNELAINLKLEMDVYDRLVQKLGIDKNKNINTPGFNPNSDDTKLDKNLLLALLNEIRDLREQLQQSIVVNNALRLKLEEELGRPLSVSPSHTPYCKPQSAKRSLFSSVYQSVNDVKPFHMSPDETPTKDYGADTPMQQSLNGSSTYSTPNKSQNDTLSRNDSSVSKHISLMVKSIDYDLFKQLLHTCIRLISTMKKERLHAHRKDKNVLSIPDDLNELHRILKEMWNILLLFKVQPGDESAHQNEEVDKLKGKISELQKGLSSKDDYIKSTLHLLMNKYTNHENIEQAIADKLLKAKETLKTTKGNLKIKSNKSKNHDRTGDSELLSSLDTFM